MNREQYLISVLSEASKDYYQNGNSKLSDKEFDDLVEELRNINPNAEILSKIELHDDNWNYKLETLPTKLYSISKVKSFKEIENWISFVQKKVSYFGTFSLILTPKFDGIKLLKLNDNYYTRYETGDKGYNVTKRIKVAKEFDTLNENTEGEFIISKSNFKNCIGYSSSRNFIPAIFASKKPLENQSKVDYICYSIYNSDKNKSEQLDICNKFNCIKVPYLILESNEITEEKIIAFYKNLNLDYECDGVVIDVNSAAIRKYLGETNKYLDCCRAYKGEKLFENGKETEIENIQFQMSRYGKLTPVAKVKSVFIEGGNVTNVSLYNMSYVKQENIYKGQKVIVSRMGKINPKITDFLSREHKAEIPSVCPFCGSKLEWDENHVELYCTNENCKERKVQQIYFFLKTIGVKDFGLESIKSLVYKNNLKKVNQLFDNNYIDSINVEGIGDLTKQLIKKEINKLKEEGVKLEVLQEASCCFDGIGSNTFKILNSFRNGKIDLEYLYQDSYYNEVRNGLSLKEGIGLKTADSYLSGLYKFNKFYYESELFNLIKIIKEENTNSSDLKDCKACFTGFRNEELKQYIEQRGGKVLSSVSSNCKYLVLKDKNSTSSKAKKARELNIEILSIEEFRNLINFKK